MKNDDEYIKKVCSTCKYKKNDRDICEIRTNIAGKPQCVNYEKRTFVYIIKSFIKKIFKDKK